MTIIGEQHCELIEDQTILLNITLHLTFLEDASNRI